MNDPLAGMSMIFTGIGIAAATVPPVAVIMGVAALGFAAWSYFGWGGYEPCNA